MTFAQFGDIFATVVKQFTEVVKWIMWSGYKVTNDHMIVWQCSCHKYMTVANFPHFHHDNGKCCNDFKCENWPGLPRQLKTGSDGSLVEV